MPQGLKSLYLGALMATPLAAGVPDDVTPDVFFDTGTFSFPVALRHAGDGSGRIFIVERAGRIRIVAAEGQLEPEPFLDLSDAVDTAGEGGLLGLAFHPDYAQNGRFFVNYTFNANPDGGVDLVTRISEFQAGTGDPDRAEAGGERVLLEIPQDRNNHNGGDIHFGPGAYLYIGMGDGGGGNDPCNRAQTLDPARLERACGSQAPLTAALALHGKMLRIDVDHATRPGSNNLCGAGPDGAANYAVPRDNPFAGHGDACGEVWAYGLRNPYRFSFDRLTGDLWIADVGQNRWEEVNFEPAGGPGGLNYGWKICEGFYLRGSTTELCTDPDLSLPVLDYSIFQQPECAITGGFRYRGQVTSLRGRYVYGDFCSGRIWLADGDGQGGFTEVVLAEGLGGLTGFGEDEDGRLYALRSNGRVLIFDGLLELIFADRFES